MSRWISSAACTLALVAVLFFLPVWGVRSSSSTAASIVSDTAVSNVRIVKRSPKPVPVQPAVQNKNAPSIPIKPAQTLPAPDPPPPVARGAAGGGAAPPRRASPRPGRPRGRVDLPVCGDPLRPRRPGGVGLGM